MINYTIQIFDAIGMLQASAKHYVKRPTNTEPLCGVFIKGLFNENKAGIKMESKDRFPFMPPSPGYKTSFSSSKHRREIYE